MKKISKTLNLISYCLIITGLLITFFLSVFIYNNLIRETWVNPEVPQIYLLVLIGPLAIFALFYTVVGILIGLRNSFTVASILTLGVLIILYRGVIIMGSLYMLFMIGAFALILFWPVIIAITIASILIFLNDYLLKFYKLKIIK